MGWVSCGWAQLNGRFSGAVLKALCHGYPCATSTARLLAPGILYTVISRRHLQRGAEAGADGFVQGSVFGEVLLGA